MRGRYVVLVVLIVAVWWMHRRTPDAEAVAPPASTPTRVTTAPAPRTFTAPTPRPELPPITEARGALDKPLPTASPNTVHGLVTTTAGEPIKGVLVSLESPTGWRVGASDDDGYYTIDHVPASRYSVRYSYQGHVQVLSVLVGDDMPTESYAAIDLEQPPVVNGDDIDIDVDEPIQINEQPIKYDDPAIDWN